MLQFKFSKYVRACLGATGGISQLWVFDPADFDFTQAAPVDGVPQPYTAVARRAGATAAGGGNMFPIPFQEKEAQRTWKQSTNGCSVLYAHELKAQLPQLSQDLTALLRQFDVAGCCAGLGFIIEHNDGKLFVLGEKYVNGNRIPPFKAKMDGSDGDSGKTFSDFNGANVLIKADYFRDLYEFTGGSAAIAAFEPVP